MKLKKIKLKKIKLKIHPIGMVDILKLAGLPGRRNKAIRKARPVRIKSQYRINDRAKTAHPDYQLFTITGIMRHEQANAATFIMKRSDGGPAAYFRAGQYISIRLKIGDSFVTRPYSICSSPAQSRQGTVSITVKSKPDGFVADRLLSGYRIGDTVLASAPEGTFYYEKLRDAKNVTAIAGGSGITPFLSMAQAIAEGSEDFNLTILYGSRTADSILFKRDLDLLCSRCPRIKVVYVISDGPAEGQPQTGGDRDKGQQPVFEQGFIDAELIRKYSAEPYSIFICGPTAMYRFLEGELEKLGTEKRRIRRELFGVTGRVWEEPGYPEQLRGSSFTVKVRQGFESYTVKASADEPVLVALERAGIKAPSHCRSGECGWCGSELVSGEVFIPAENDGRRYADRQKGRIHLCSSFPLSDLEIVVPGEYYASVESTEL